MVVRLYRCGCYPRKVAPREGVRSPVIVSAPDCNVPSDDEHLGSWIASQRKAYSGNRLSSDQLAALDALGFAEEVEEESESEDEEEEEVNRAPTARVKVTLAERWETNYERLVRFYRYVDPTVTLEMHLRPSLIVLST